MPVNVDPMFAKIAIAADVIEMPFGIDYQQSIRRQRDRSIPVNGPRCSRVRASVYDERGLIARDEAGVDGPRRQIPEASDREASIR